MKKFLLLTVLFFSIGTLLHAQDVQKKQQFQWNKKTMDELAIAADVQEGIDGIKKNNDGEIKKVKEDAALTEEQKKEKLKELRRKRMTDIEAMLTPEQKAKADEMKKAIAKKNKENG